MEIAYSIRTVNAHASGLRLCKGMESQNIAKFSCWELRPLNWAKQKKS